MSEQTELDWLVAERPAPLPLDDATTARVRAELMRPARPGGARGRALHGPIAAGDCARFWILQSHVYAGVGAGAWVRDLDRQLTALSVGPREPRVLLAPTVSVAEDRSSSRAAEAGSRTPAPSP